MHLARYVEESVILVTALSPVTGCEKSEHIARKASGG